MKRYLFVVLIIGLPGIYKAQPPKIIGLLDGKTYTIEITEDGKKKPLDDPDNVSFRTGKFKSALFLDWGAFKSAKYSVISVDSTNASAKVYSWTTTLENDQKEKLVWSATINGEEIEGTIEFVNSKGLTKRSYTFDGKEKKKPGKKT